MELQFLHGICDRNRMETSFIFEVSSLMQISLHKILQLGTIGQSWRIS